MADEMGWEAADDEDRHRDRLGARAGRRRRRNDLQPGMVIVMEDHPCGLEPAMGAACMSLLDAFDIVIGIDTEYVSGENRDGVPKDENAVFSYQAYYFHPATGKSNGGYYTTGGPDGDIAMR